MRASELTAADLMSRNLLTAEQGETLRAAAKRMNELRVQALLVPRPPSEGGIGILALKDIVQVLIDADETALDALLVADAMTSPVFSVQDDMRISDCVAMMRMAGVRRAPVFSGKQLVGVLSFTDILDALVAV